MKFDDAAKFEQAKVLLTAVVSELDFLNKKLAQYSKLTIVTANEAKQFTNELAQVYQHLRPVANVQQDIYANTLLLWSEEHNELTKKICKWRDDCQEAMEMVNILERFKPKMTTVIGNAEYEKLRVDVEKRCERILSTRQAKIEHIMSQFLSLQNTFFSTAVRLSNNLNQNDQPSVPDIAAMGTEYIGSLLTSWREKIFPRQNSEQSISSGDLHREEKPKTVKRQERIMDPIFPDAVLQTHSQTSTVQPKTTAYNPPSQVEDLFPGLQTYKTTAPAPSSKPDDQKSNIQKSEPEPDMLFDLFGDFSKQPETASEKIPDTNKFRDIYIDTLRLMPEEVQLGAGGKAVTCYFELNTAAIGDQITIDCMSNLLELTSSSIVIAKGTSKSNSFELRARPDAPCGFTGVQVLLSGNSVQNLRKFEYEILVEIIPASQDDESPKRKPKPVEKIIPVDLIEHQSDEEADFWDVSAAVPQSKPKRKPERAKPKPKVSAPMNSSAQEPPAPSESSDIFGLFSDPEPAPAPAPQQNLHSKVEAEKENDVFSLFSPSDPAAVASPDPVVPDPPVLKNDPNDLSAMFGDAGGEEAPKKVELKRFEQGIMKSTGEGFRETDLPDVFNLYRSPLHAERMDPRGFAQAWSHLCLTGDWRKSFKSASRPEHPNAVTRDDFCNIIHERMTFEAEKQVSMELDRWEFDGRMRRPLLTLMQTMKHVLTYDTAGWKPPQLADMMRPRKVRAIKRKTSRIVHPDRTKHLIYPDRARALRVYRALDEAFKVYRAEHSF